MNFLKRYHLLLIVAAAFLVRIVGVNFGLYHPDEPMVVNQALAFGSGNLVPQYYFYASLLQYALFFLYGIYYLAGYILGPFREFGSFAYIVLVDQTSFYLIGRSFVALLGALTVVPVYFIACKICSSRRAAVFSSIFMASMYLHVRSSHYCTVDVPVTFMIALAYIPILDIVSRGGMKSYLAAGILAALAMSTKYNAVVLLPCIGIAGLVNMKSKAENLTVVKNLSLAYLAALVLFLVICSYIVYDFSGFMRAVDILFKKGAEYNVNIWFRFRVDLLYGMGLILGLMGIAGFLRVCFSNKKYGIVLLAFPVLYFLAIRRAGQTFGRYTLPVLPFFAVSAGVFLDYIVRRVRFNTVLKAALISLTVGVIIASTLARSIYADRIFARTDTRDLAKEWIYDNIPYGSRIAVDQSLYAPNLMPTKEQLAEKLALAALTGAAPVKQKRIEMLLDMEPYCEHAYDLCYFNKKLKPAQFIMHTPQIPYSVETVFSRGVEYVVTSDVAERKNRPFYDAMAGRMSLTASFSPFRPGKNGYSSHKYSYLPLDNSLFNMARPGVIVKIYEVTK